MFVHKAKCKNCNSETEYTHYNKKPVMECKHCNSIYNFTAKKVGFCSYQNVLLDQINKEITVIEME